MKRIGILSSLVFSMGLLLTGCSNPFDHMPDLTEEESALISEYAAGIVLKHDKYGGKLAGDAEIIAADDKAARLKEAAEAFAEMERAKAEEEKKETEQKKDQGASGEGAEEVQTPFAGIAEFSRKDGFQIQYTGYSVCDSYPEEEETDKFFAMDATEGNQLLVLKFSVINLTEEEKELDMFSSGTKFKIAVNGEKERSVLTTLLLDDLSSYKEVLPPETEVQTVLIREITAAEAENLEHITLYMQKGTETAETSLK